MEAINDSFCISIVAVETRRFGLREVGFRGVGLRRIRRKEVKGEWSTIQLRCNLQRHLAAGKRLGKMLDAQGLPNASRLLFAKRVGLQWNIVFDCIPSDTVEST